MRMAPTCAGSTEPGELTPGRRPQPARSVAGCAGRVSAVSQPLLTSLRRMEAAKAAPRLVSLLLAGSVVLTAGAGAVYGVGQQAVRRTVEDAPRALLTRTIQLLSAGESPEAVVPGPPSDLGSSSLPFAIVYDSRHTILASSAVLAGSTPPLPPGVLDVAAASGEHTVTWQPAAGVREAVVASPWRSPTAQGVAVAGISLAAAERRTDALRSGVAIGWLLAWLAMMLAAAETARRRRLGGTAAPGQA